MTFFVVFFILIQLGSLTFMAAAIYSLFKYIKQFRFDPSDYNLLFGFLHLRQICALYALLTIIFFLYATFFFIKHYGNF